MALHLTELEKEARVMAFKNSQTQSRAQYGADQSNFGLVDAPQSYYQICCFTKLWTMVFQYALPIIPVTWMASFLQLVGHENLQFMDYNKDLKERVLASYSLMSLLKISELISMLSSWDKELLGNLQHLSLVTWTANEQLFQY